MNTILSIRNLELADLDSIARLHLDHMPLSFPKCKYYFNLLKISYSSFLNNKESFCVVANIDNEIVGYVCLVKCLRRLHIKAFKNYPLKLFRNIIMLICRYPVLFLKDSPRRLQSLSRSGRTGAGKQHVMLTPHFDEINYELRPIVVRADYQGTSLSHVLMSYAEKLLKDNGVKKYFLRVRVDNIRAINLYRKFAFKRVGFEGEIRVVMVKALT